MTPLSKYLVSHSILALIFFSVFSLDKARAQSEVAQAGSTETFLGRPVESSTPPKPSLDRETLDRLNKKPPPNPSPDPSPTPSQSDAEASTGGPEKLEYEKLETMEEQPWKRRFSYYGSYALGIPGNLSFEKNKSTTIEVGTEYYLIHAITAGIFYRSLSGVAVDEVYFSNTGYTETREYQVTARMLGLSARFHPNKSMQQGLFKDVIKNLSLRLGLGLSLTTSVLNSTSSTAPIGSPLSSGERKNLPAIGTATLIGLNYGYAYRYFGIGAELGYDVTAWGSSESFNEIYGAVLLRVYPFRPDNPAIWNF